MGWTEKCVDRVVALSGWKMAIMGTFISIVQLCIVGILLWLIARLVDDPSSSAIAQMGTMFLLFCGSNILWLWLTQRHEDEGKRKLAADVAANATERTAARGRASMLADAIRARGGKIIDEPTGYGRVDWP